MEEKKAKCRQLRARFSVICVALVAALGGISCRTHLERVYNPSHDLGVVTIELETMKEAIRGALYKAGWTVVEERPQETIASVVSGRHSAKISVSYTSSSWRIQLMESSPGLQYDGQVIHKRYSFWISRLDRHMRKAVGVAAGLQAK